MDNSSVNKIVSGIIRFLTVNHKLHLLPQVVQELQKKSSDMTSSGQATVTSSYRLTVHEIKQIQQALKIIFHKKLNVINEVNTALIAGLHIRVQDKVIDLSLNNTLENIKDKIEHE